MIESKEINNCFTDNNIDKHVDLEILECLSLEKPKSFFMFAGAGSGKTRSLVNVLNELKNTIGKKLYSHGQRIAIITYTNDACDEIKRRIDYNNLFQISTIHSFVWSWVGIFHYDIKEWFRENLPKEIEELNEKLAKTKPTTKSYLDISKKIEKKKRKLENLVNIKKFIYNPNGDNLTKDSLNHTEVIKIGKSFIKEKTLIRDILVRKFPILLVDESQDTNKDLMDAFFYLQKEKSRVFSLGLFGDTMQRIYMDGKKDLAENLPKSWETPAKIMNHRSALRIVDLINNIRSSVDKQEQKPRSDASNGFVRVFLFNNSSNREKSERDVLQKMSGITNDLKWLEHEESQKLTLEHHMAAERLGFSDLFGPLYAIDKFKTGLLDGTLSEITFFTKIILPIFEASKRGDKFTIAKIVREKSPAMFRMKNIDKPEEVLSKLKKVNEATNKLLSLWKDNKIPSCIEILNCVAENKLFEIPDNLEIISSRSAEEWEIVNNDTEDNEIKNSKVDALDRSLKSSFEQIIAYNSYICDKSSFKTHQGVKGLEFDRVMVILDDNRARGNSFSYNRLFGTEEKTDTDKKNENEGKETSIDRTRRLFYVACSRAKSSLAVIVYSDNVNITKKCLMKKNWFTDEEIIIG